jgi:hypothetical protein
MRGDTSSASFPNAGTTRNDQLCGRFIFDSDDRECP